MIFKNSINKARHNNKNAEWYTVEGTTICNSTIKNCNIWN